MIKFAEEKKKVPTLPILFILGNGFDLSLKMKTRYENVYEKYIIIESKTENIEKFKAELKKHKENGDWGNWADFELGMAEYAKTLSSEDDLIECVRDFKKCMVQHLKDENSKMEELFNTGNYDYALVKEFSRSLEGFYDGFSPNIKNELKRIRGNRFEEYDFITLNYTNTLESLIRLKFKKDKVLMRTPLHIHGTLDNEVVLGVDNSLQLESMNYTLTKKGKRAFIKTYFNEEYDSDRVKEAKSLIKQSSIICTYGFSFGKSDKTWVDAIVEWLIADKDHHLIVYQYDTKKYDKFNFETIMEAEEEKIDKLLKYLDIKDDKIARQIHIPINYDIFNFEFKKVEVQKLPQRFNVFDTYSDKSFK